MTTFDEREHAFENKFAHDEEVRFRVLARRNKALAAWACARMNKTGTAAAAYQDEMVAATVAGRDDATLAQRIADDLAAAGHDTTPEAVRAEMAHQMETALQHERTG